MTRRFEFEEGGSSKFWEVSVVGSEMTVNYGRIGTNGQAKTKSFATPEAAQKEADKLIAEKTKKGYAEVGGSAPAAPSAPTASAPAASPPQTAPAPQAATPKPKAAAGSALDAPAIVASAADPSVPSTVIDGETVTFSPPEWVREECEPSIDTPMRPRKAGSFEDTWKGPLDVVQRNLSSYWKWPESEAGLSAFEIDLMKRAKERLATRTEGETFDADLEAYTFVLGRSAPVYPAESVPLATRALARWTLRTDPATALRTLFRAERLSLFEKDNYRTLRALPLEMTWGSPNVPRAIREHLRQYGRSTLEPIVRELYPHKALLAWILDDEALASQALAEGRAATPHQLPGSVVALVPSATDAGVLLGSASVGDSVRAVLRHGIALAEPVLRSVASDRDHALLWACYPSVLAARRLVPLLENKTNRKLVGDALAHMPAQALIALEEAKGKKNKYKDALDALIATLSAAHATPASSASSETSVDEAPLDALPRVLQAPPWHAKKKAKELTLPNLVPQPVPPTVDLASLDPKALTRDRQRLRQGWSAQAVLDGIAAGQRVSVWNLMGMKLEELETLRVAGALTKTDASYWVHDSYTPGLTTLLDVHGPAVIPALVALAPVLKPALCAELEYAGAIEIAPLAIEWLTKKNARRSAGAWVRRFPRHAAAGLLPLALGGSAKDRERAITLLGYLRDERAVVLEEAARHGAEVTALATALLDRDPLENAPSKAPKLFDGLEHLPKITFRDGRALPPAAQTVILEMLAFSPVDAPYLGLEQVKEACDPRSLDLFVEALVRAWVAGGMSSAHEWAVRAVALIGSDRAARFLYDRARAWALDGQKQRAMLALEVLGAMGSDLSLSLVGRVSRSGQRQYLKDRAVEILREIADARDLTADELEDRTAPDLGLDEQGTMVLDFGPRAFRVGFDEHLLPFAKTESGERLDALPRVNKNDDADKAKAAWETWKALRSEAEKVAKDQIARLERMMGDERTIEAEVFLDAFVKHPLVGHLTQRLVWGAIDAKGTLLQTFRVAEDRSLSTIGDDPYLIPEGARVALVHPLRMHDEAPDLVARWGQVLGDYAIVQPFGQLTRPVLEVDASSVISRYVNKTSGAGLLFGLRQAGWRGVFGEYADIEGYEKELGNTRYHLRISPPIPQGQGQSGATYTLHLSSSSDSEGVGPSKVQLAELVHQLDGVVLS